LRGVRVRHRNSILRQNIIIKIFMMETIILDKDIKVFYVIAKSFPEGIMEAHQALHKMIPFSIERKYFGISRPEHGSIVYRAAGEELQAGEAQQLGLETLILKQGEYTSLVIKDHMKDIPAIDKAFKQLLAQPGLDPQGYCVEWYLNDNDVRCMIRLKGQSKIGI
jgi:predicted transcriptional regulator YdeE